MSPIFLCAALSIALFFAMLACLEIGRRIGHWMIRTDPEGSRVGLGAVEGAVFALLGLLIAFTFSTAEGRFEDRRHLVVQEANAVGTAYLRIDLVSPDLQSKLRALFRSYVDARLDSCRKPPGCEQADIARCSQLQSQIWETSVAACRAAPSPAPSMLLLPALNEMFDIATTRSAARIIHPPGIIFAMLAIVALGSALLGGYGMAAATKRSWLHIFAFVAIISGTIYVICDIEFPRRGIIRVDAIDQILADVRSMMK